MLTLGAIKNSGIPARLNLCSDDSRLIDAVNRACETLLLHGSWYGTTQRVCFRVVDDCFVLPGCIETIIGVRTCNRAISISNGWHQFIPDWEPFDSGCNPLIYEFYDLVPSFDNLADARRIRSFASSATDYGKTITYQGYDKNGVWVRTLQGSEWQDGETVTLASPFITTTTEYSSITAVIKAETNERITAFSLDSDNDLVPFSIYEYWETRPTYQRFKIHGFSCNCSCRSIVEAQVKLKFQPVRKDGDTLLIHNLPALELAMEALKAKDDGDLAKADLLLFGNQRNGRLGAIPILQQELRTTTDDRFAGSVSLHGTARMRRVTSGFI